MIAALSRWHDHHERARRAVAEIPALPAHVLIETYSVLTRLPGGLAVPADVLAGVLSRWFPEKPLMLDVRGRQAALADLAAAGVDGGAAYDGLVALEARAHDKALLTLDVRATGTYRRLGVEFSAL